MHCTHQKVSGQVYGRCEACRTPARDIIAQLQAEISRLQTQLVGYVELQEALDKWKREQMERY